MSDNMEIRFGETVRLDLGNTIPVPERNYVRLVNKPQINGIELDGNVIIKVGDLENDAGYLTEETDPTVPFWAKQPNKPTYTPEEIGAMPNTVIIPIKLSQLENDSGYYIKPVGGIPLSDFAPGVIPDFSSKIDISMKGAKGGVAELDSNGMVPSHQLPSYVDDVKTYSSIAMFPTIGEDDKIYIDKSTNKQYRWSGDMEVGYVPIASSLALGETAQTAYRGDRGKVAYDHALAKGQAFASGLYKVTTNAEGHIIAAVAVAKEDITDLGIPGSQPDVSGFYTKPVTGIPASDIASGVIPDVSGFYTKPAGGIPASDLADGVIPDVSGKANLSVVAPAFVQATANDPGSLVTYTDGVVYVLPDGRAAGATWANTTKTATNIGAQLSGVKNAIQGLDNDKYEKPSGGIPATDMTQAVQTSLSSADSAYQKPSSGIPASDLAEGVIPPVDSSLSDNSTNAVQNKVVKGALDTKAPVIINTATGNPAVFNDGGGMPLKSLLIPFAPKQTGSGDPSPSNIRPIVPWEGLTVYHSGADTSEYTETDISFPSPVYGGTLDAVSGVLTVDTVCDTFTWGDVSGSSLGSVKRKVFQLSHGSPNTSTKDGKYCDKAKFLNDFSSNTTHFYTAVVSGKSNAYIFLPNETPDTETVQVAYPLATPQEIQLTPQQITALVGNNTIWSDADGSMTVEYPADTKTYINNLIATAIASL